MTPGSFSKPDLATSSCIHAFEPDHEADGCKELVSLLGLGTGIKIKITQYQVSKHLQSNDSCI